MIPKIIHYCWFGGNPLPESAIKCIASWRKYLPDYEIWAWVEKEASPSERELRKVQSSNAASSESSESYENENENLQSAKGGLTDQSRRVIADGADKCREVNSQTAEGNQTPQTFVGGNLIADKVMPFDVNIIPYTKEAYGAKKYAFVSDYARFWVLEQYGGLYFDTDVEVIKDMTPIINAGPYMGCELQDGTVNPGLGLAAEPHMPVYKQILENYLSMKFLNADGTRSNYSMIPMVTELLRKEGLKDASAIQNVLGLNIYPVEYFNPYDSLTGRLKKTENTYSIHWYDASWADKKNPLTVWIKRFIRRIIR